VPIDKLSANAFATGAVANSLGYTPANKAGDTFTGNVVFSANATVTGAATFSNNVTITGNTTFSNTVAIGSDYLSPYSGRNKFINGDMRVWQRGTSFSSIGTSTYAADRWFSNYGGTAPTFSRSTDVPTGFQYSFSLVGSSTSYHGIGQRID
jgi:hypothetical protein